MKAIRIKNAKEFESLLDAIRLDCAYARSIWRQRIGLTTALTNNPKDYDKARTFWFLTFRAHDDAVMLRLGRIYDQHRRALSLLRLLLTIKDNLYIFGENNFRDRFKDHPFVENLNPRGRTPDAEQLSEDILATSIQNPLVKKLSRYRGTAVAHRDPQSVISLSPSSISGVLTKIEVSDLVEGANTILHRYRMLFNATTSTGVFDGLGDYKHVLKG